MKTIYASFLLIFAVWVTTLHAQTVTVVHDNSTTFVVPAGVTTIKASLWGAGARGSSTAGGGGGAYASTTFTNMVPGSSHAITIGSGTSFSGNKSTIFNNLTANGTSGSSGASVTTGSGIISYPGGNGAVGSSGGGGAAAGTVNAGQSASGGVNGVGINGGGSGGGGNPGGGGKQTNPFNGFGGNGRAILEWTCPASGSISYTNPTMFLGGTVQNVNYAGIGSGGPIASV
ncbi:MAG: hypothetical protein MUE30_18230, partial [Spirosomaceae bacterium]|nr:hypothetical protein [Spirosomataceae bacterium]